MRRGIIALVALGAWGLQAGLLHGLQVQQPIERLRVPPLAAVQLLKTDLDNLIADGAWIAVLVHNGGQLQLADEEARDFSGMYEALDMVGQLDPRFTVATTLGAWMLADGRRVDEARRLLQRRSAEHPTEWQFPFHLGFVEFLYARRYVEAAQAFMRASQLADCPPTARRMAAALYARGNKAELAIATWQNIYAKGDTQTRGMARRALAKLGVQVP